MASSRWPSASSRGSAGGGHFEAKTVERAADAALASSSYLLGARPSIADFGLAAQLDQMRSDPTAGALIQSRAPNVARWLDRMRAPRAEGGFDSFEAIAQRLGALAVVPVHVVAGPIAPDRQRIAGKKGGIFGSLIFIIACFFCVVVEVLLLLVLVFFLLHFLLNLLAFVLLIFGHHF